MKNIVHISCKHATYLVSKKEESRLTFLEKARLKFHLSICSFCRLFQEQTHLIGKHAKHAEEYHLLKLSDVAKAKIKQRINDLVG